MDFEQLQIVQCVQREMCYYFFEVINMQNDSLGVFVLNLEKMLITYETYDKLALHLGVSTDTLKSWMLKTRSPKLSNLDTIANKIGCYSYDLINSQPIENKGIYNNNSRICFVKNLRIIFTENACYNLVQQLNLLNNVITDYILISYLRNSNYRTPTLKKLDLIADQLNLKTFELIKEEKYEKSNNAN